MMQVCETSTVSGIDEEAVSQRDIIMQRIRTGKSYSMIARELKISRSCVAGHVYRAKEKLMNNPNQPTTKRVLELSYF